MDLGRLEPEAASAAEADIGTGEEQPAHQDEVTQNLSTDDFDQNPDSDRVVPGAVPD